MANPLGVFPRLPLPRFVIVPGFVLSANDGQRHHISAAQLANCYNLRAGEATLAAEVRREYEGRAAEQYGTEAYWVAHGLIPLYPRRNGDYMEHRARLERALQRDSERQRAMVQTQVGIAPTSATTLRIHDPRLSLTDLAVEVNQMTQTVRGHIGGDMFDAVMRAITQTALPQPPAQRKEITEAERHAQEEAERRRRLSSGRAPRRLPR